VNHQFSNPELLQEALTHTSFAYENDGIHNERLEFLGDAVLQLFVTEILYETFPEDREGVLHIYRTRLVSTDHLARLAKRWNLDKQVRLGRGEEASGGREKGRLLAGTFEAVVGAIHLDAGHTVAREVVRTCILPDLDDLPSLADPRKNIHEWCQRTHGAPPDYNVVSESGPAHEPTFTVEVVCGTTILGKGAGTSKRSASIAAATAAAATTDLT
jgi:ribonuclease-3